MLRHLLTAIDDVYTICQNLKINKFSILAHSAGAIYALATALRMPQHIRGRIHLLAPWIPPSQMNVIGGQAASPPSNALPTSQRILRALPTPILKAANSSFMSATSSSITSSLPKTQKRGKKKSTGRDTPALSGRSIQPAMDKQNHGKGAEANSIRSKPGGANRGANGKVDLNSEEAVVAAAANSIAQKERQTTYDARLTQAIWDLATSGANPAVDLLVCLERRHTIGFRYVDITRAVVIHHGSKDTRVPVENVRWLGKTMRRCEVRVLEGEGHGLMASAGVMGSVLMEIAREWEDWAKVTGLGKDEASRRALRERASVGAFR
jgi:pimeloyl-ACP methyl ester carboxylesterase